MKWNAYSSARRRATRFLSNAVESGMRAALTGGPSSNRFATNQPVIGAVNRLNQTLEDLSLLELEKALERNPEIAEIRLVQDSVERLIAAPRANGSARAWRFFRRLAGNLRPVSENLYERLPAGEERELFLRWVLYRYADANVLRKDELAEYDEHLRTIANMPRGDSRQVAGGKFPIIDLTEVGMSMKWLYSSKYIVANDFLLRQYHHSVVHPRAGDVLLDLGAYTGDTAMVFTHDTNYDCMVHSFEMSNANIAAFRENMELNPRMKGVVKINQRAVADSSGETVMFDEGEREDQVFSAFSLSESGRGTSSVETISIDDYVKSEQLPRVDFIKMDIEGAERLALRGCRETIRHHKPRLAISLYHLEDDLYVIPALILEANPNYRFHFKWVNKRLRNEAVLFAIDPSDMRV